MTLPSPIRGGLRRLGRLLLALRFRLFQRHRHDRVVVERVAGIPFVVLPGVMNPVIFLTGRFLAEALGPEWIPEGSRVLDVGTGSGVCAVVAGRWAAEVMAVDLEPQAVRCTRMNVLLHGLEARVDVREGDLFAPVPAEPFDVVLFNPPYLRGAATTPFERTLRSADIIDRFTAGLGDHLAPHGSAYLLLSSVADEAGILRRIRSAGFSVGVVAQRDVLAEVLTVYRICHE